MASSPLRPGASVEDELAYYKAQYEQLEVELQEFQASSRDLEAELEKDVEASEKRERTLKEQVEGLRFEVDEWKTKHKQSKGEANAAQTTLQKEITTMRDANRTLQLKLRDTEVVNDDYERQARNTTSSLEDMESKHNVAIERAVMLEEEMRSGEQERECLRIETQRLRDELSDLRIESEITTEKLRLAETTIEQQRSRKPLPFPLPLSARPARPRSPTSDFSATVTTSPTASTPPPTKSEASTMPTPPSPTLSDASAKPSLTSKGTLVTSRRSLLQDSSAPRPSLDATGLTRHSRGPSLTLKSTPASNTNDQMGPPAPRQSHSHVPSDGLARSGSLYQIKGLIGRMQKIEERVHSVRSKLPPPGRNSPRASPRPAPVLEPNIPAGITVRSGRKRQSTAPSVKLEADTADGRSASSHMRRLSFGVAPAARADRPAPSHSRPGSRASNASHIGDDPYVRPSSRFSMGGARTALSQHPARQPDARPATRPQSSMSGKCAASPTTRPGRSTATRAVQVPGPATPIGRRSMLNKISTPTPGTFPRRESGATASSTVGGTGRRSRMGLGSSPKAGTMPPPMERRRKLSGVGETF